MSKAKGKKGLGAQNRPQHEEASGDHPVEREAAVERGERIDTGKTIARGGKQSGHVAGATTQPPEEEE